MPMSRPHYGWWGYVKDIIRRYPTLCEQEKALHETCISPDLNGMPHGSGTPTDPVADAALRELPEINRRELEAVRQAIAETLTLDTGQERLQVIRCVFWDKTHTLEGAAMKLHISYVTARRWHGEFIRLVGKIFGFL